MKLSTLTKADHKLVASLSADVAAKVLNSAFFNWSYESTLAEFCRSQTLIIKKDAQVLAFLSFREYPDQLEIMALAAASSARRQGLGGQLIKELHLIAAQRRVPIYLEVHENNQQAVNFYLKNRFLVIGSRKSYYSDGGLAVIMQAQSAGNIQS